MHALYIKEVFTVVPVVKFKHCIQRVMVLKELAIPIYLHILRLLLAIAYSALVHTL